MLNHCVYCHPQGLRAVVCVCILKGAVLVAAGEAVVLTLVPGNQLNDLDP